MRHQAITAVSHLFLSEVRQQLRGEKPGVDVCQVRTAAAALVRSWGMGTTATRVLLGRRRSRNPIHPTTQRRRAKQPYSNDVQEIRGAGHPPHRTTPMRMEQKLAL